MLGFIIGTVCLIGLIKTVRGGHGHPFGWGTRRRWLRFLFEKLDTGPGQEKVIVAATDRISQARRDLFEELRQTRRDLGRTVSGDTFDQATLDETFARQDRVMAGFRTILGESLREVHESLDSRQRKILAEFLEGGCSILGNRRCGGRPCSDSNHAGPYRSAATL